MLYEVITGPDLARVGKKYSDEWHVQHLKNPQSVVPESVMPQYAFLAEHELNAGDMSASLTALYRVGVPYTKTDIEKANRITSYNVCYTKLLRG